VRFPLPREEVEARIRLAALLSTVSRPIAESGRAFLDPSRLPMPTGRATPPWGATAALRPGARSAEVTIQWGMGSSSWRAPRTGTAMALWFRCRLLQARPERPR